MKRNFCLLFLLAAICSINVHAQIISTIAGSALTSYSGDGGPATAAGMTIPTGIAMDRYGNVYFADNNDGRIRKIDTSGIITTVAGNGTTGFLTEGVPATSSGLYSPTSVAIDTSGNIYIADELDHRVLMVNTSGIIHTFAGTGTAGYNGDGIQATDAKLWFPSAVAIDRGGNVYITDQSNYRIRKVNTSGVISTIAGTGASGCTGDGGPATAATLQNTENLSFDNHGNMYFSDYLTVIRKIDTAGIITTVAGVDTFGYSGDGGPAIHAKMNRPICAVADTAGNLYITDGVNNCIRKVNTAGIISTFAGTTVAGFSGDNGPATAAKMNYPWGIVMDNAGIIYFADGNNRRIRKIAPGTVATTKTTEPYDNRMVISVYPNPNDGNYSLLLQSGTDEDADIVVSGVTGNKILRLNARTNVMCDIKLQAPPGIYFLTAHTSGRSYTTKVVVTK